MNTINLGIFVDLGNGKVKYVWLGYWRTGDPAFQRLLSNLKQYEPEENISISPVNF